MKFTKADIVTFWGSSNQFSNWYQQNFVWEGITFNCSEQYMMYRKAILFGDIAIASQVLFAKSPKDQKALGRKVTGFNSKVWDQVCVTLVFEGLCAKFSQNQLAYDKLMSTVGKTIIEASPVDRIWGAGLAADDPRILDTDLWNGAQNLLGETLMRVRTLFLATSTRVNPSRQLSILDSCA